VGPGATVRGLGRTAGGPRGVEGSVRGRAGWSGPAHGRSRWGMWGTPRSAADIVNRGDGSAASPRVLTGAMPDAQKRILTAFSPALRPGDWPGADRGRLGKWTGAGVRQRVTGAGDRRSPGFSSRDNELADDRRTADEAMVVTRDGVQEELGRRGEVERERVRQYGRNKKQFNGEGVKR